MKIMLTTFIICVAINLYMFGQINVHSKRDDSVALARYQYNTLLEQIDSVSILMAGLNYKKGL
jgi:uncharacterized protein YpmB